MSHGRSRSESITKGESISEGITRSRVETRGESRVLVKALAGGRAEPEASVKVLARVKL